MQLRSIVAILMAVVLAACAPVASPRAPTSAPTATIAVSGATSVLQATGAALPAGRYTATGFALKVTLELDGTWEALNLLPDYFDLGHATEVDDVTLVQFALADGLFEGADASTARPVSAANAVAVIQANRSLKVIETSVSRIGGLDGHQVTVEPATDESDAPLLSADSAPVVIDTGRRVRVAFFDTPRGLLAIMVNATTGKWEAGLAAAEPVLESITFVGE